MKQNSIVEEAKKFATKAHQGQFLKNAFADPFITHPARVAELVSKFGGTDAEVAAAWLHDVVEDTDVTLEEIRAKFGDKIAEMVDGLTDPLHFSEHPHRIRKAWQAKRVAGKSASVKRVKLADQTLNTQMVGSDPPVGWDREQRLEYIEGARLISIECRGISEKLDELFERTYRGAVDLIRK